MFPHIDKYSLSYKTKPNWGYIDVEETKPSYVAGGTENKYKVYTSSTYVYPEISFLCVYLRSTDMLFTHQRPEQAVLGRIIHNNLKKTPRKNQQ